MQAILPLGNDIVDIGLADNRTSAANHRYVDRVLAPEEHYPATFLLPDARVFWAYWAAKEAAYKALVKTLPGLVFAHRRFVVYPATNSEWTGDTGSARGVVMHANGSVPVTWTWQDEWVHCLTDSDPLQTRYRVAALSDCRQQAPLADLHRTNGRSDASVAVRQLALSLLARCGLDDVQIVRAPGEGRLGPPRVLQDGRVVSGVDISLSHDGRYAAAAIRVCPASRSALAPRGCSDPVQGWEYYSDADDRRKNHPINCDPD